MKNIEEYELTSNSNVYKKARWKQTIGISLLCYLCAPHHGCNGSYIQSDYKSWKRYRKNQWRNK